MRRYRVMLTEGARKDLSVIYRHYIECADAAVADMLLGRLEQAIVSLECEPLRGGVPSELQATGVRCRQLLQEPFRLIYRVEAERVLILLILHQKQSLQKALSARLLSE